MLMALVVNSPTGPGISNVYISNTTWGLMSYLESWIPENFVDGNWYVSIGSGNGLVSSDNKPLTEPKFCQIYIAI